MRLLQRLEDAALAFADGGAGAEADLRLLLSTLGPSHPEADGGTADADHATLMAKARQGIAGRHLATASKGNR